MTRWMLGLALSVLAAGLIGCQSGDKGSDEAAQGAGGTAAEAPAGEIIETTSITGVIVAIDHYTRDVAVQGPKGNVLMFEADPAVKNLDQVNVGDEITVTYLESLAVHVRGADESAPGAAELKTVTVAPPGDKPAMMMTDTQEISADVVSVDKERRRLLLKNPAGELVDLEVSPRVNLETLSVGDQVIVTHTEAVGIAVHAPR